MAIQFYGSRVLQLVIVVRFGVKRIRDLGLVSKWLAAWSRSLPRIWEVVYRDGDGWIACGWLAEGATPRAGSGLVRKKHH